MSFSLLIFNLSFRNSFVVLRRVCALLNYDLTFEKWPLISVSVLMAK